MRSARPATQSCDSGMFFPVLDSPADKSRLLWSRRHGGGRPHWQYPQVSGYHVRSLLGSAPPSASAIILLGFPTLVKRHRRTIERAVTRIHMRLDENSDYTTDRIQCHSTREPEIWSGVRRPAHCTCITEEALPFARFCTLMACRTHGTGRMARGRGKML